MSKAWARYDGALAAAEAKARARLQRRQAIVGLTGTAANVGTPLNVPLHPTQLYEAGAELVILVLLLVTERKGRPYPGRTLWAYMFLYAVSRFVIEFYRADERGAIMGLSTSQFISLILAPLSVAMRIASTGVNPASTRSMISRWFENPATMPP